MWTKRYPEIKVMNRKNIVFCLIDLHHQNLIERQTSASESRVSPSDSSRKFNTFLDNRDERRESFPLRLSFQLFTHPGHLQEASFSLFIFPGHKCVVRFSIQRSTTKRWVFEKERRRIKCTTQTQGREAFNFWKNPARAVLCAARACCVCRPLINGEECIHPSSLRLVWASERPFCFPRGDILHWQAGSERASPYQLSQPASLFVFTRTTHSRPAGFIHGRETGCMMRPPPPPPNSLIVS